jgi:hypothetical protein
MATGQRSLTQLTPQGGGQALYPQTGDEKLGPVKATPNRPFFVPRIKPGQFTPDRDQTRGKRYFKTKFNPNQPFNLERPTVDRSGQVRENEGSDLSTKLVGDVDPFTGKAQGPAGFLQYDEQGILIKGLTEQVAGLAALLEQQLVAMRNIHPTMVVTLDGPTALVANVQASYYFEIDGRRVTALSLLIQNNTGQIIYVGLSNPATTGDYQIPSGGSLTINDVSLDFISFLCALAVNVNGQFNRIGSQRGVNALVVTAWSNPEYRRAFGQV